MKKWFSNETVIFSKKEEILSIHKLWWQLRMTRPKAQKLHAAPKRVTVNTIELNQLFSFRKKTCSWNSNYESWTRNQLRLKVKRNAESSVKGTFVLSAKSTSISKEHWIRQSRSTLQKQRWSDRKTRPKLSSPRNPFRYIPLYIIILKRKKKASSTKKIER